MRRKRPNRRALFRTDRLEHRNLLSAFAYAPVAPGHVRPAIADPGPPLQGNFKGVAQVTFTGPATASVQSSGTGKFAGLGNSTVQDHHTVAFQGDGSILVEDGVTTVKGANGGLLVLDYQGTGVPNGFGGFNDTYNFTVDGAQSTGKFAGVTEGGVIHASDLPGGSIQSGFAFTGSVDQPAPPRPNGKP